MPSPARTEPARLNEFTLNFEIRRAAPPGAPGAPANARAKGGKS